MNFNVNYYVILIDSNLESENTKKRVLYSSAMTYGFPTDLIRESQNLRGIFGRYRYIASGFKKFVTPTKMVDYESEIYYKDEVGEPNSPGRDSPKSAKSVDAVKPWRPTINLPRVFPVKSKSACEVTKPAEEWKKFEYNEFLYYAVVTHEIRSSINDEVVAPFARIDDGSMYIMGMKAVTRFGALRYLARVAEASHLEYERFFYKKVTELKVKNPKGSYLCIDGEPFKADEYTIKVMPSYLRLIGKPLV